jgi:hypothetical protein
MPLLISLRLLVDFIGSIPTLKIYFLFGYFFLHFGSVLLSIPEIKSRYCLDSLISVSSYVKYNWMITFTYTYKSVVMQRPVGNIRAGIQRTSRNLRILSLFYDKGYLK